VPGFRFDLGLGLVFSQFRMSRFVCCVRLGYIRFVWDAERMLSKGWG